MATEKYADSEWITADVEPAGTAPDLSIVTPADDGDARSAVRRTAEAARSKASAGVARVRAEGPERVRQAGRTVRGSRLPAVAVVLAALGGVAVLVARRRAAATAAAAKSRRPVFLRLR
jgi:hypothetical protein